MRHRDVITSQTKTRDRVRHLAEVYTHKREVDAMLDLVADMFPSTANPRNVGRTFLEPACGSGNFLVEILERKLAFVTRRLYRSQATFEAAVLKALSSIYGIDIDPSNVDASRGRPNSLGRCWTSSRTPVRRQGERMGFHGGLR